MTDEYSEMLVKLNEIVNELRNHNHNCDHEHCCIRSLLQEIEFD